MTLKVICLMLTTNVIIGMAYSANDLTIKIPQNDHVIVRKCCNSDELMDDTIRCIHINGTDSQPWAPIFTNEKGEHNIQISSFRIISGVPECGAQQQWIVYHYQGSSDRLILLPNGLLRHYIQYEDRDPDDEEHTQSPFLPNGERRYHDYAQGTYCVDKVQINETHNRATEAQIAVVCVPQILTPWTDSDFVITKIVNPVFHVIAAICLTSVAVVYFVLPPLRDLVGNILTSLTVCLVVSQVAGIVQIYTELTNHVSFLAADVVMYVSLLAAFFWLNSFGYYIWKTFRSRNVFLRVTDGRKYCYYSGYVWGTTALLSAVAVLAHFFFDEDKSFPISPHGQKTIGWLGNAMFFTPIAFTVLVNLFFYLTTGQAISRMQTYGRIHHKMKFSFQMFIKLFLVMSIAWLFLLLSWLPYSALFYCHIAANALQAPLILIICVLSQKRVMYLLKKTCCYKNCVCPCCRPDDNEPSDWGEEMMSMNTYN